MISPEMTSAKIASDRPGVALPKLGNRCQNGEGRESDNHEHGKNACATQA